MKVRLEYYFEGVGQISFGVFRRDFKNFFGNTVFQATPEFLALYGLDPTEFSPYEVSTQYNIPGRVRMERSVAGEEFLSRDNPEAGCGGPTVSSSR